MPGKNSTNIIEPTPLRRSKRLLAAVAAKIQKLHSEETEVQSSPIVSTSLENVSCKKDLVESVSRSANCLKSGYGSKSSTRKTNGSDGFRVQTRSLRFPITANTPEVSQAKISGKTSNRSSLSAKRITGSEGFKGLRRSPRFSLVSNTPEILAKKNGVRMSNETGEVIRNIDGVEGFRLCPISEDTPEMFGEKCVRTNIGLRSVTAKVNGIVENKGSRRTPRFAIVEKTPEILHMETGLNRDDAHLICRDLVDYMDKEVPLKGTQKRKSVKRGRQILEVTGKPEVDIMTPAKGKENKKRNVKRRTCSTSSKDDSKRYKKCCDHQKVQDLTLTQFRTPLSSVKEIIPKQTLTAFRGKSSTKLVEAKSGLYRPVKSTCGPRIKAENSSLISNQCGVQGWTKDQELALQRAYFAAKPSPHFWKKISKMVPGKSAQDCFDKVQSNNITPSQPNPRYRSRTNRTNLSPLEPTKLNIEKSRGNKPTKRLAQKTVRHILQKQNQVNQGHQRDLFSILEPTVSSFTQVSPETNAFTTPKSLLNKQDFLRNYQQRSLSSSKNSHSRVSIPPLSGPSPAVLKHIKNITSHEKYIDQLHCREARRIAEIRRCASAKDDRKDSVQKTDVIKAARNALESDARDIIKEFQQMQTNLVDISEDFDDVGDSSGGDDAEC